MKERGREGPRGDWDKNRDGGSNGGYGAAALLAERAAAAESMIFAVPLCPRDMAHCIGRRTVHPKSA